MATNKPIFYRAVSAIIDRADQLGVTTGQFIDGCNRGVASGGIGINTGDFNPKESDFSRDEPRYASPASYIGQLEVAQLNDEAQMWGLVDTDDQSSAIAGIVGFDYAETDAAADAEYGSSLTLTNYTGKTIPADGWAWGFEAAGGDPVAPIVDAGPDAFAPDLTMTLAGVVTPGTDPDPDILWTVFSGGTGTFSDPTSPTSDFTLTGGLGVVVFVLTASPDDGPPVSDSVEIIFPV